MNQETFLRIQTIELQGLLEQSADDPIIGPQLQERLADAQKELDAETRMPDSLWRKEPFSLPRAAFFLRGGGVEGSEGIRPALAGEALIQYEKMFVAQAVHDERIAAKSAGRQRRPRGAGTPGLLFTGTPRGSFGMEFVPQVSDDQTLLAVHAQSLVNVADALTKVVHSDSATLTRAVDEIPATVLKPLKQFLRTLAQHDAELRLAFSDRRSQSLSAPELKAAADLLEREVEEKDIQVDGIFRGLTQDTGYFDVRASDGNVLSGTVADELTEEDMERISKLTNRPCVAEIHETIMHKVEGPATTKYVLINARKA